MSTPISGTAKHQGALRITFGLTVAYFSVEVLGGFITNSLALLADAGHMLTDVGGLALALFAAWMSQKRATPERTYGYYRVEILAALANALVLFGMSFYILYEAYRRFQEPPEVASLPMLAIALVGLGVNLFGVWNLRRGSKQSMNVEGAFLEVVSDALSSVGAIAAGLIMLTTAWYYADPIFSALIGLFIVPRAWRLMVQATNVLLEGTPAHINVSAVEEAMRSAPGVEAVHDLHVWTITSGIEAMSAHVALAKGATASEVQGTLELLSARLRTQFGITHTTLQIEHTTVVDEEARL